MTCLLLCASDDQEMNLTCTSPNSSNIPPHGTSTSSCFEDSKDRNSCPTASTIIIDEDEVKKAKHECYESRRDDGDTVNTDSNKKSMVIVYSNHIG